jgi:hypothetical protein
VWLVPRRPDTRWRKTLQVNDAPTALQQSYRRSGAPAIAHLDSFSSAHFRLSGPLLADRLSAVVSGNLTRGARRERSDPRSLDGREAGVLAHFVYTPTSRDEVRLLGGVQRLSHPYEGRARFGGGNVQQVDNLLQVQSTWQRQGSRPWSLTTGLVRGVFDPHLSEPATGTIERLSDGPVQQLFPAASTRGRYALTGWFDPFTNGNHAVRVGTSLSLTRSTTRPAEEIRLTPEKVGGLPARVWDYGWTGPTSWRGNEVAAYVTDDFRFRQLSVNAGLRYESSRASAANSDGRIEWTGVTPRVVGRVRPFPKDRPHLTLLAGYAEYLSRLPLNLLAYGDPGAPHGAAYQWQDQNRDGLFQPDERGLLVARVGPGGARASIDPDLKPPRSKEVFIGFETDIRSFRARFLAYHRRESDLVTSVNYGAPTSAYDVTYYPGPRRRHRGGDHAPDAPRLQPPHRELRAGPLPAHERHADGNREGPRDLGRRPGRKARARARRRHRLEDQLSLGLPRVPGHRERPGSRGRAARAPERGDLVHGAALLRTRIHDQDRRNVRGTA